MFRDGWLVPALDRWMESSRGFRGDGWLVLQSDSTPASNLLQVDGKIPVQSSSSSGEP